MPNKEDQIMNLQRLLKATQVARRKETSEEDRRTAMAIIKQLTGRTTLPDRTNSLNQLALELMLAGNDKSQTVQILAIRENLTPAEQRALEEILLTIL